MHHVALLRNVKVTRLPHVQIIEDYMLIGYQIQTHDDKTFFFFLKHVLSTTRER